MYFHKLKHIYTYLSYVYQQKLRKMVLQNYYFELHTVKTN